MATNKHDAVVGVFETRGEAEQAVNELRRAGFRQDQIGLVARDDQGKVTTESGDGGTHAGVGAAAGAAAGAGIGGLIALGLIAGVIPAIGPVIAGGTLATILANAAGGAAIGGLVGVFVGMGIPQEDAEYYEGEVHSGRFLVTVKDETRYEEAWQILHRFGAYNRQHPRTATATTAQAAMAQTAGKGQKLELREEELRAQKQTHAGEVRVRKEVVTEHKTLEVPVQREEVVIERHPVAGHQAASGTIREGEEIRIPVREEEVHAQKVPVVKEEVTVAKKQTQGTQTVSGTVRKEQAKVETEGEARVQSNDPNANRGTPPSNPPRRS